MVRRNTNQKQIVYDSLSYLGHASSEELIDYIKKNYSNISLATIYRNLTILMEDKLVKKIKLDNIDVYETVKERHYHYQCKCCNKIIDVTTKEIDLKVYTVTVGNVDTCDVMLYGICNECQKNNKEKEC